MRCILSFCCFSFLFCSFISCHQPDELVLSPYQPKHDHEAYIIGLQQSGLNKSALGLDWIKAAAKALSSPTEIKAPYQEEFYTLPNEADARSFQLDGLKGQKIEVDLEEIIPDSTKIFLDAYRVSEDSLTLPLLIASMNEKNLKLGFEIKKDGQYIIRFQNELLRGGRFKINIKTVPTLAFPVAGRDKNDIGSLFGVPREAGRRVHEGIDIFAKRHTPIIAPTDANINMAGVKEGSLGGKVIWMRDTIRNQSLYFAHLEDVFVTQGDKVQRGDTIGSVGNSGNAITTYPHLHFGIYQNGAIDPFHHIVPTRIKSSKLLAKNDHLGKMMKTNKILKLSLNGIGKKKSISIDKNQLVQIIGVVSSYYHVRLPDETEGFVFYNDLTTLYHSQKSIYCADNQLFNDPHNEAILMKRLVDQEVKILAGFQDYSYVETANDLRGWMVL